MQAFRWLSVSRGPLNVEEIAEALAVMPPTAGEPPIFDPLNRLYEPHDIFLICSSLVTMRGANAHTLALMYGGMNVTGEITSLAHYSVKEHFCSDKICAGPASKFHVDQSDANASVAEACITYLLQIDGPVDNSTFNELPLARYAASYWHIHAQAGASSPNSKNLQPVTLQLLQSNERMAKVRRLAKPHYPHRSWTDKPALHWAAQYGPPPVPTLPTPTPSTAPRSTSPSASGKNPSSPSSSPRASTSTPTAAKSAPPSTTPCTTKPSP